MAGITNSSITMTRSDMSAAAYEQLLTDYHNKIMQQDVMIQQQQQNAMQQLAQQSSLAGGTYTSTAQLQQLYGSYTGTINTFPTAAVGPKEHPPKKLTKLTNMLGKLL